MFSQNSTYVKFIKNVNVEDITTMNFKSSHEFNHIMDNVSKQQGQFYIERIEEEFPHIRYEDLRTFVNMNDKYGNATKSIYEKDGKLLYSNPSNMRYMYFALLILTNIVLCGNTDIVEIGAGYGGLFLAINHFSQKLNIPVGTYTLIDLPEMNVITAKYLVAHKTAVSVPYTIVNANFIEDRITGDNLYVVSNYCFTEIDSVFRDNYVRNLFPKVSHGFMAWQTCMNSGMNKENIAEVVRKPITKIEPERPQTGPAHSINYFVYI